MHSAILLLLLVVGADAIIYPRHPSLPPFLLGRPPGGFKKTLWYHMTGEGYEEVNAQRADDPYPWVVRSNYTQRMNQSDSSNTATWNQVNFQTVIHVFQRYWYNPKFFKNNTGSDLIFLFIGGEGPEGDKWVAMENITYLTWAQKYGAAVFDLEHRFFGYSRPIKLVQQSLALNVLQRYED